MVRDAFTWTNLFKNIAIITVLVGLNRLGIAGNVLFYLIICAWALTSTPNAVKALSVGVLALVANTIFVEKSVAFTIGRFLLLFAFAARVYLDGRPFNWFVQYRRPAFALILFILVAGFLAYLSNYYRNIAWLKLINFGLGAFAILASVEILRRRSSEITCWMVSLISVVVIMGLAAYAAGQGYNAKEINGMPSVLFNGPFYHPNTLGPLGAMMVVYLAALLLCTPYRLRHLAWPLMFAILAFVYLTKSRTAIASTMGGIFILVTCAWYMSVPRGGVRVHYNLSGIGAVFAGIAAGIVLLLAMAVKGDKFFDKIETVILKSESGAGINVADVIASRQGQIDMTMFNFQRMPFTGIGFGTSTHPYVQENASLLSAPTEKGNLVLGVLEETGAIGTRFFTIYIGFFVHAMWRNANVVALGVFGTFLLVNMGEMMFFSFGGHGAFGWMLLGAAMALGDKCIMRMPPPQLLPPTPGHPQSRQRRALLPRPKKPVAQPTV
jgi:hypothetical protein